MQNLQADIAAFARQQSELEAEHFGQWVVFYQGQLVDAYNDFESAASDALERFDTGPYLIRQVGAPPISLSGGMIFTPKYALGQRRV